MNADSAKNVVRILLDLLEAHGVRRIVCSPGSRNAPLLIAAEAREALRKYVVIDERSAAFAALGMAQTSLEPVALVCTSGTALLNYAPAVAEAYYQGLPLIVISADRPMEWIDQDDSQTIRQPEALRNFVKGSYSLSDHCQCDSPGWYETRMVNDAMLCALAPKRGPVHINVRLAPPLGALTEYRHDEMPRIIRRITASQVPDRQTIRSLAMRLLHRRVMLVAGFMSPDSRLNKGANRMRLHGNVTLLAETISNLHLPAEDYAVDASLCMMTPEECRAMAPDVVISIGGALVSRMLKEYLRECGKLNPELEHWAVGYTHTTVDCFQALTARVECDPARFISLLSAELAHLKGSAPAGVSAETDSSASAFSEEDSASYAAAWRRKKLEGIGRMDRIAASAPWTDMKAMHIIFSTLPKECNLQISNGTSVRYAQILSRTIPHAEYCNRGVSGIDGSTSTAVGASLCYPGTTVLLTGDTSMAYDLSALLTLRSLRANLKIIVISNGGGAIFRFISSTSSLECRERYFCADPALPVEELCRAFGMRYLRATSESELKSALGLLFGANKACEANKAYEANEACDADMATVLEVVTPAGESADTLRQALNRPS